MYKVWCTTGGEDMQESIYKPKIEHWMSSQRMENQRALCKVAKTLNIKESTGQKKR